METVFWGRLVVGILATWRITHLLAHEDGPADLTVRFRDRLGSGFAGKRMCCNYGHLNRTRSICFIWKPLFTGLSAMSHRLQSAEKP
jgi:hypothetical protein